jgi:hypothetical protein
MGGIGRVILYLLVIVLVGVTVVSTAPPAVAADPAPEVACEGDECQVPPPAPDDPVPGTAAVEGPGNPPVRFPTSRKRHPKHGDRGKHQRHRGAGPRGRD